jgi:hypothetical protein
MSSVKSVVWSLRCDRCGFTDYLCPSIAASRRLGNEDGWHQFKPRPTATKSRTDLCPECSDDRTNQESQI